MHQYPYSKVLSAMLKFSVRQSLAEENIALCYKHVATYKNCPKTTLILKLRGKSKGNSLYILKDSTPERTVRVRALAGDIVLCSWARHFTLTVPLSTQVYKWLPANLILGGNPGMD